MKSKFCCSIVLSLCFLEFSVGVRAFCHRTDSNLFLFPTYIGLGYRSRQTVKRAGIISGACKVCTTLSLVIGDKTPDFLTLYKFLIHSYIEISAGLNYFKKTVPIPDHIAIYFLSEKLNASGDNFGDKNK